MIVTGDRDIFQLIDERATCKVMATARGITDTKIYDRQAVIDRYGIPPELIPDFYGLKGDSSDNIPGVPGIGDKTASELIQSFGSLEEVLAHVDDIKRAEAQTEPAGARRGRTHVKAPGDGPARSSTVDLDVAAEAARAPDRSRVREVFREYELRDPLRRLEEALATRRTLEPAAACAGDAQVLTARVRAGSPADMAGLAGSECGAVRRGAARASRRRASCSPKARSGALRWRRAARCSRASARGRRRWSRRAASAR